MRKLLLSVATILVFGIAPAAAQDGGRTALDLPEGQALVNLSATERVTVQQDMLTATLNYEAENKSPRDLQNDINGLMKKALEKAKSYKDVKVSTQQYYVYVHETPVPMPVPGHLQNENIKREKLWRGSQGLHLESKSADDLLELAGILQDMGMVMSGLNYAISPGLLETTHESLMEAALSKLKTKADRAAKALGKAKADLIEINVDSGGQYYPPVPMMTMAMSTEMTKMDAPVASPGETDISMTVSARALLKP